MEKLYSRLERGEESEAPGLMEQWLREKKLTEEEIVNEAAGTFGAGVDTVSFIELIHWDVLTSTYQKRGY